MSISMNAKATLAGAFVAFLLPADAAQAQMRQDEPDVMDVARTPLEDLNIDSKDIPEVLQTAVTDPYASRGLVSCNDIVQQIAVLDNILGPDFDIPQEEARRINAGRIAKSVVGSIIPFRGIVREVSGANKKRNQLRIAVTAGMVRRGYLKGMGEARGCNYPARPRQDTVAVTNNIPPNIPRSNTQDVNQDLVPIEQ